MADQRSMSKQAPSSRKRVKYKTATRSPEYQHERSELAKIVDCFKDAVPNVEPEDRRTLSLHMIKLLVEIPDARVQRDALWILSRLFGDERTSRQMIQDLLTTSHLMLCLNFIIKSPNQQVQESLFSCLAALMNRDSFSDPSSNDSTGSSEVMFTPLILNTIDLYQHVIRLITWSKSKTLLRTGTWLLQRLFHFPSFQPDLLEILQCIPTMQRLLVSHESDVEIIKNICSIFSAITYPHVEGEHEDFKDAPEEMDIPPNDDTTSNEMESEAAPFNQNVVDIDDSNFKIIEEKENTAPDGNGISQSEDGYDELAELVRELYGADAEITLTESQPARVSDPALPNQPDIQASASSESKESSLPQPVSEYQAEEIWCRIDHIFKAGIHVQIIKLLDSESQEICCSCLYLLGNLSAGRTSHKKALLDCDILTPLVKIILDTPDEYDVSFYIHCCWIIVNLTSTLDKDSLNLVTECDFVDILVAKVMDELIIQGTTSLSNVQEIVHPLFQLLFHISSPPPLPPTLSYTPSSPINESEQYIMNADVLSLISDFVLAHKSLLFVQEYFFRIIMNLLFRGGDEQRKSIQEAKIGEKLTELLKDHQQYASGKNPQQDYRTHIMRLNAKALEAVSPKEYKVKNGISPDLMQSLSEGTSLTRNEVLSPLLMKSSCGSQLSFNHVHSLASLAPS